VIAGDGEMKGRERSLRGARRAARRRVRPPTSLPPPPTADASTFSPISAPWRRRACGRRRRRGLRTAAHRVPVPRSRLRRVRRARMFYQQIADALGERPLIVRTLRQSRRQARPWLRWSQDNPALACAGLGFSLPPRSSRNPAARAFLGSAQPVARIMRRCGAARRNP